MGYQAGRGFTGNQVVSNETTLGQLASMNARDYGFHGFYQGRKELTGTPDYDVNWLPHNRPGISEGTGRLRDPRFPNARQTLRDRPRKTRQEVQGRSDWSITHEPPDISGISNLRPSPPSPTMPSQSGYNLTNVRPMPGSTVEKWGQRGGQLKAISGQLALGPGS